MCMSWRETLPLINTDNTDRAIAKTARIAKIAEIEKTTLLAALLLDF